MCIEIDHAIVALAYNKPMLACSQGSQHALCFLVCPVMGIRCGSRSVHDRESGRAYMQTVATNNFVGVPAVMVDKQSGKRGDAVEVLRSSRRLGLSMRQTKCYPRHCRWQDVVDMRGELVAYQA